MLRVLSLVVVISFAPLASAQSQLPAPGPSKAGQPRQVQPARDKQPPAINQRGTEQSPVFIKLLPAQVNQVAAAIEGTKSAEKPFAEWFVLTIQAVAALVVAIFTWKLQTSTDKLWDASERQSKMLKESVDTAINSSSPFLFPRVDEREEILATRATLHFRPSLGYVFDNHGKTPAIITEFRDRLIFADRLPDRPFYVTEDFPVIERGFVVSGESNSPRFSCRLHDNVNDWPPPDGDQRRFYLIGYVKFEDFFDFVHTTRFCLMLIVTNAGLSWRQHGGDAYNERRKVKKTIAATPIMPT